MQVDIGDAAFVGFKLIGRKPWVPLVWGLVYFLAILLGAGLVFGIVLASGTGFPLAASATTPAFPDFGFLWLMFPVIIVFIMLASAVFLCGAYRMVLEPENSAFAYLRLGMRELRLAGVLFLGVLLWMLVYFGFALLAAMLGVVTLGIGMILAIPAGLCLFAFLATKLSLTGVVNFAEGKLGFGESWEMTRNNFWPLFAVYLILFVIMIGVWLVSTVLQSGLQAAVGQPSVFTSLDPSAPAAMPTFDGATIAVTIVGMAISALVSGVNMVVLYAPHAEAYRQLKPPAAASTSEVFA